jgi:3-hydroxybutyrate dehydrogenase
VRTPLVEKQIADQAKTRGISEAEVIDKIMLAPQPTKKFTTVEQIGGFVVFLCSDSAANITGAMLPMDGGWTVN